MKTKLILIGGVPGTGKTTIAYKLALNLKIDKVLSVDMLKIFAKTYNYNFSKYVFTTTHEAYKIDNISVIDGYLKHSNAMNRLLLEILYNIKDKIIIIEGCTINKEFVEMINKDKYDIIYFNLYLPTVDLLERYKLKVKVRKSNWIENIKIIEEINNYLSEDNVNFLNNNLDSAVEGIIEYVKKNLCI